MKTILQFTSRPGMTYVLTSTPRQEVRGLSEFRLVLNPDFEAEEIESLITESEGPHCVEDRATILKLMKSRIIEHIAASIETV